jgi:hypothetical protein
VSGYGRIGLISAVLAAGVGAGVASLHAQTQLSDPKDAPKIFASTCSACHKSPAGLAKSGQVAGFLRQHYTTGPEMSAAMAAYLVSAGSGPAGKKEAKAKEHPDEPAAAKGKQKRQEALVQPAEHPGEEKGAKESAKESAKEAKQTAREKRLLLRKQLEQAKAQEHPGPHPSPASAAEAASRQAPPLASAPPAETSAPAAAPPTASMAAAVPAPSQPPAAAPAPAPAAMPPVVTLDIPLPEMPTAPPTDLTQSVFSSSPVP